MPKPLAGSAHHWLENLGLDIEPFEVDGAPASWVRAIHACVDVNLRDVWRGFLAITALDPETRTALDVAWDRSPDEGAALAQLNFDAFHARLAGARIVPIVLRLQERRARRISGRSTGIAINGLRRPDDLAFFHEGHAANLTMQLRPKKS